MLVRNPVEHFNCGFLRIGLKSDVQPIYHAAPFHAILPDFCRESIVLVHTVASLHHFAEIGILGIECQVIIGTDIFVRRAINDSQANALPGVPKCRDKILKCRPDVVVLFRASKERLGRNVQLRQVFRVVNR